MSVGERRGRSGQVIEQASCIWAQYGQDHANISLPFLARVQ
ncbi:MAG TPA: hypothetical protein VFQ25_04895 [Ktedonobacterales bacterium]|nr:hypothetical protein [Ktedonobacterales bacterium]